MSDGLIDGLPRTSFAGGIAIGDLRTMLRSDETRMALSNVLSLGPSCARCDADAVVRVLTGEADR